MEKKQVTIEELTDQIKKNEQKREDLFKKKAPIDREIVRLYDLNSKLRGKICTIKKNEAKKDKKTDWKYVLHTSHNQSSEEYKYQGEMLRTLGLMRSGYYSETEQVSLQIALVKGDPKSLEDHYKGLRFLLPYLKTLKDKCIHMDIIEAGLSERESWSLTINMEKKEYKIVPHRSKFSKNGTFNTLRKALEFIQENVWYESKLPEDNRESELY